MLLSRGGTSAVSALLLAFAVAACPAKTRVYAVSEVCGGSTVTGWSSPRQVAVVQPDGTAYAENVEEPEVRDFGGARWLFFNDDPSNGNKDLRYARWDEARQAFVVLGLLPGAGLQTPTVDGNPALDQDGGFFFISTRTYPNPSETIHAATLTVTGSPPVATVSGIRRLDGLTRSGAPWASQGVQVTWDSQWLFFDEAKFDGALPSQSDIVAARRSGATFTRLSDAELEALLGKVNTATFLEYAEALSADGRELFFTRTWVDLTHLDQVVMCVMRSTRADATGPFDLPGHLAVTNPVPGVVMEAPSLSPDEKTLYYHRRSVGEPFARLYALDRQ